MKQALFYKKINGQKIQCQLCNHFCQINNNKKGICQVRKNIDGILYSLNYGKIIANHIDPIEKKPLNHFLPDTLTYSIASAGCNFKCLHCQNADISQIDNKLTEINNQTAETSAREIIRQAIINKCPSISYTYTEPTIFAEFALECMKLVKERKLKNIWVSNGYMSTDLLEAIRKYLDAINIDLKFFKEESYQKICKAKLQPVLDNLIWIKKNNIHLEVTTLIIPTINDSEEELKFMAKFIFNHLGADTPWHISAFYPTHKLTDLPATSRNKILLAQSIGEKIGLKYIF